MFLSLSRSRLLCNVQALARSLTLVAPLLPMAVPVSDDCARTASNIEVRLSRV